MKYIDNETIHTKSINSTKSVGKAGHMCLDFHLDQDKHWSTGYIIIAMPPLGDIPYTRKFPRYVNFTDFAVNSKAAKIYQFATITESSAIFNEHVFRE